MTKIMVLYYSSYGHVEQMAYEVMKGAKEVEGVTVDIKRVPELVPEEIAKKSGYKVDQEAPIAKVEDLETYDAIIIGVGTRYGRMASQMANFWDQTGGMWAKGVFNGKVGSTFTSTASQHGGQETTLMSNITSMLHLGMIIVGLPYSFSGLTKLDEVSGGTPYGASTLADGDGSRWPSQNEFAGARYQGRYVAEVTAQLMAGRKK